MNSIEPIFIILPLICVALSYIFKRDKLIFVLVCVLFIIFYSFSLNGSDYEGYKSLYNQVVIGDSYASVHGEYGYYLLMKIFVGANVDYIAFRIILLSVSAMILFYVIAKVSKEPLLSVFLLFSMFVIYTISTYRQFIVMSFSILFLYFAFAKKAKFCIYLILPLALFHKSAIIVFIFAFLYKIMSNENRDRLLLFLTKNALLLLGLALFLRLMAIVVLNIDSVRGLLRFIIGDYVTKKMDSFLTIGFASRLFFYLVVIYLLKTRWNIREFDPFYSFIITFYLVGQLLYCLLPYSTFMGRLFNNTNIYIILILPKLISKPNSEPLISRKQLKTSPLLMCSSSMVKTICCAVAFVILVNQLLNQDGYFPYIHSFNF